MKSQWLYLGGKYAYGAFFFPSYKVIFRNCSLSRCRVGSWQEATAELQCALRSPPLFPLHWQCMRPRRSRFLWPKSWQLTMSSTHSWRRLDCFNTGVCAQPNLYQPLALILIFTEKLMLTRRRSQRLHISLHVCDQSHDSQPFKSSYMSVNGLTLQK